MSRIRSFWVLSTFCFSILLVFSTGVYAATLSVEKWGSDANACTKASPCLTIGHALNQANNYDKVIVGPGIYKESIRLGKEGLKLESTVGLYGTILTSRDVIAVGSIVALNAPKVQFGKKGKGFTVTNTTDAAVSIELGCDRCKIEGNRITGNDAGIYAIGHSDYLQIRHNIVEDNAAWGIYCNCNKALIIENRISDNGYEGINIGSGQATVARNILSRNGGGIRTYPGGTVKIVDNVVELSGEDGFQILNADGSVVQGNISARNGGRGGGDLNEDSGFKIGEEDFINDSPLIKKNLAMGNASEGFVLRKLLNATVVGNTAIQNANEGINITPGTTISSLKTNNTYRNDSDGINCGLRNDSGSAITYTRHYFGGGDIECGTSPLGGTLASSPSAP